MEGSRVSLSDSSSAIKSLSSSVTRGASAPSTIPLTPGDAEYPLPPPQQFAATPPQQPEIPPPIVS